VEHEGGLSKEVVSLVSAYLAGQTGTMELATQMEKIRLQRSVQQTPAIETQVYHQDFEPTKSFAQKPFELRHSGKTRLLATHVLSRGTSQQYLTLLLALGTRWAVTAEWDEGKSA